VFYLAVCLRYDSMTLHDALIAHYRLMLLAPVIAIPIFIKLGLYRAVIRYIDHKIVYVVVLGVSISVLILLAIAVFTVSMVGLSRGVFIIYWISAILYVLISRFLARAYFTHVSGNNSGNNVAIYGAGRAGTQLASALSHTAEYRNVAFIDDKKELQGAVIAGINVYPSSDLAKLVANKGIQIIILAMPSLTKAEQKEILHALEPLKVRIKITPSIKDMMNSGGEFRVEDVREIEIEDLLGRDPVVPDPQLLSKCIQGKSVMVTGAGGSIGSELCRQILRQNPKYLVLMELTEFALYQIEQELQAERARTGSTVEIIPCLGSVLDQEKCFRILQTFAVETVYHAAAYKHVPLVEHNPIEGVQNNILGTLSMAQAAIRAKVSDFVLISTDKAVRPTNVMGATKRFSEQVLQALSHAGGSHSPTKFCMVRFGNVLGSSGSVVPLFRKQIHEGGPITVTHFEITRYFMTIPEAAQLVLQAGAMGLGGDVFVLDMGEPVKIIDLAKRMVHLSGRELKTAETPDGTIEIHQVGLRPGEKLFEELLIGDNAEGTGHPLIMKAQEGYLPWDALQLQIDALRDACTRFDHEAVRAILRHTVPEYTPPSDIEDLLWRKAEQH
jgi:FlaA1/EpsC-like NDP-sugar epimerase